jgi:hypothetical protein
VPRKPQLYGHGELVVVIDCSDLARSAEFWAQVLGYVPEGPALGTYQGLIPADGQGVEILLQRVPEGSWNEARTDLCVASAQVR